MYKLPNDDNSIANRLLTELRYRLIASTESPTDIATMMGIHPTTVHNFIKHQCSLSFTNYCLLLEFCLDHESVCAAKYEYAMTERKMMREKIKKRESKDSQNASV